MLILVCSLQTLFTISLIYTSFGLELVKRPATIGRYQLHLALLVGRELMVKLCLAKLWMRIQRKNYNINKMAARKL